MLCLVNNERAKYGLPPLAIDDSLRRAAQEHSDDQAAMNTMSHAGSDGTRPGQRVERCGYEWQSVAENVAYGFDDEQSCMHQWMQSPGHRENILGSYTHFGSAVAYSGSDVPYYTQNFASNEEGGGYYPVCDWL